MTDAGVLRHVTPAELRDMTPAELDDVLAQARDEQWAELVLVGSGVSWLAAKPEN